MKSDSLYKTVFGLALYLSFGIHCIAAQSKFPTFEVNRDLKVTVDVSQKGIFAKLTNDRTVFLKNWKRTLSFVEAYDVNNDGHMDLVLNSEDHSTMHALIFLFDPKSSTYWELSYPGHEFSNLVITEEEPGMIISYINSQEWYKFGFKSERGLYRSGRSTVFSDQQLGLDLYQRQMYNLDGSIKSTRLETFENESPPLLEARVARLRLYDEPNYNAGSDSSMEKGALLEITAFEGKEWLKVKYKYAKEILERWVNVSELKIDVSKLQYAEDPRGLNLVLLNPRNGDDKFYFSIALNNYSGKVFESYFGRIYILLKNENGNNLLYPLYRTGDIRLLPQNAKDTQISKKEAKWLKPGFVIDDNRVEWDPEKKQFFIYHDESESDDEIKYPYVPFFPEGIPHGKYKMSAVFLDSESCQKPLVSNSQELVFPLKKVIIDKKRR